MSNKTLAIILIILVLAAGGTAAALLYKNNNSIKMPDQYSDNNQPTPSGSVPLSGQEQLPPQASQEKAAATPPDPNACARNFDAETLKNAKVNIANRQVEMDVKGFGKITLEFYDQDAPKTVENFLRLTNAGYYNCLTFHRVAKGFVIQGGDPTGTGAGGDSAFGGKFEDELNPEAPSYQAGYKRGVLAMANAGPNTNGSQFFILLGDVELPHAYTIFGKVTRGLDIVDKIGQVDITPQLGPTDGKPVEPVVMQSVKITK